ncbi:MAG: hypothetical protein R3337_00240 [Gammaproteobacteria bacterium]|nr:hypothetical protein [Gammaproteobacteria bacterium]
MVAWTLEWGFASPLAAERRCRQWRKGEWSPQELHEHLDGMVRLELNRCRPCIRDDYLQERESNDGE